MARFVFCLIFLMTAQSDHAMICTLKSIIYTDHELGLNCLNMRALFPSITDGLKANFSTEMIGFDLL